MDEKDRSGGREIQRDAAGRPVPLFRSSTNRKLASPLRRFADSMAFPKPFHGGHFLQLEKPIWRHASFRCKTSQRFGGDRRTEENSRLKKMFADLIIP